LIKCCTTKRARRRRKTIASNMVEEEERIHLHIFICSCLVLNRKVKGSEIKPRGEG